MGLTMFSGLTEMAEPLMPQPSAFKFQMALEKLKRYKSQATHHILAQLITCLEYVIRK
jgi:hypothetical protein